MSDRARAIVLLTLVNALWGMSFPLMRGLNLQLDQHFGDAGDTQSSSFRVVCATWIIFLRFGFALLLFPILFRSVLRQARRIEWLCGALIGALFVAGLVMQIIGLATIPASRSGFLTSLAVVFTPMVHALMRRELPSWRSVIGVLIAVFGIAILTGLIEWTPYGPSFAQGSVGVWTSGDTLTTFGAMFFTLQILTIDRLGKRYNSAAFTPGMFTIVTVTAAIICWSMATRLPSELGSGWQVTLMNPGFSGSLMSLSFFGSVLAFSWMNQYQPHVTAVQAAVIYTTEPVFASLWASVLPGIVSSLSGTDYPNERLTLPLCIGGALVLLANVLALWPASEKR